VKERDEQEVEYVSDGKVIAKEMRYAKENEFMERDGSKEDDTDWDSLSDRVKKSRRQLQKTLMRGELKKYMKAFFYLKSHWSPNRKCRTQGCADKSTAGL
jgi:hypothetical protein